MTLVALISNPHSTGNRKLLPEIRAFVAQHRNIFHVEVQEVGEVPAALRMIARARPDVLAINGGDGTIQAVLTELYHSRPFGETIPPVAVLPNGRTNLIAHDLGGRGAPLQALRRVLQIAESGIEKHLVERHLITVSDGQTNRPVVGMFLAGAGLMDALLFCRHKLYPTGIANSVSHLLTAIWVFFGLLIGGRSKLSPLNPDHLRVTVRRGGKIEGRFFVMLATTLERLLMGVDTHAGGGASGIKLLCLEQRRTTVIKAMLATLFGRLSRSTFHGLHMRNGDEIAIEGNQPSVILDGEIVQAAKGHPLTLRSTPPQAFVSIAT